MNRIWLRHKGINDIIDNVSIFFREDHKSICISTSKTQISIMGLTAKECSDLINDVKLLRLHILGRKKTIERMKKKKGAKMWSYINKCRKLYLPDRAKVRC